VIAGLLLAAGRSARFGGDKLLAPLHGRPVLSWSAAAIAGEVDVLYVVVPAGDAARIAALDAVPHVVVENAGRDAGMASSIVAGIAALPDEATAVVIALADQPLVTPAVVRRLRERWREGGVSAVATRYRDGRGHPVLFGRALFGALSALEGDAGARALLDSLGDAVALVTVDDLAPVDVDTPDVLLALAAAWRNPHRRDS
jgi:CTP:molybdopterin cytidylyltransferase MocA